MDDTVATSPAVRLAEAVRTKQISSRELLDLYLDRIAKLGGPVNAVVTLDEERARTAAAAADEQLARGESVGPLHGLPVTIKDAIETEGIRSTGGSRTLTNHLPVTDAPAVARLKRAGAIVFGKTNVPEWSGDLQTYNEVFGTTNNPWALDRTCGGSSGGPATAVACGFTSFELGTDIGGSVRTPAHFCGVYGLKPSFGVVPQRGYLDHAGGGTTDADINVFGPIARSAADLDLLLNVLAGPEPEREVAWRLELPAPSGRALADYRVGVWFDDPACRTAGSYAAALLALADRLVDAGVKVEDAHPPVEFSEQVALFSQMIAAAVSPSFPDEIAEAISGSHLAWLRADQERARLRAIWAEWFGRYDLLLCPVLPTAAFPHTHDGDITSRTVEIDGTARPYLEMISWTGLIGIVGLPSAVAPIGRVDTGLPVGVQIVAPFLHDRRAVQFADLVGSVIGGYEPPPGF
jgi:amidase